MSLGASRMDINEVTDADFQDLRSLMGGIERKVVNNWTNGQLKSMVFVYYAGHGVMDNTVYAVCNGGPRPSKYIYPLQARLNSIA